MEASLAYQVTGMRCAGCAANLERQAGAQPGVAAASAQFATRRLVVTPGPGFSEPAFKHAVEDLGFGLFPPRRAPPAESRPAWWMPAFLASAALVLAGEHGLVPLPWPARVGLATLAQGLGGMEFYRGAWKGLRSGAAGMDLLVALGATAAFFSALLAPAQAHPDCAPGSFESGLVLLLFLHLGRFLEAKVRSRARGALDLLAEHEPPAAVLLDDRGGERELPAEALRPGDRIRVRAGAGVPADGRVQEGESEVVEAFLTGEPEPKAKGPGDPVLAGSQNGSGTLVVRVEQVGDATRLGRIVALAEASLAEKHPLERLADRISGIFVPAVVLLALLAAVGWTLHGRPDVAWRAATAVLVVACPCALGLATPTALVVASGNAWRRGLVFRSGSALEALAQVDLVGLDKTGTLTSGQLQLARVVPAPGCELDEAGILARAAALERGSSHPLARAVVVAAEGAEAAAGADLEVEAFRERPGLGVEGRIHGALFRLGSRRFLAQAGVDAGSSGPGPAPGAAPETALLLARDDQLVGQLVLADRLRPEAPAALAALGRLGLPVHLLSGDRPEAVSALSASLGLQGQGGMTPEEKHAWIQDREQAGHRVAYVGDGINDAAALARASAGIAMGRGAELARQASSVVILSDSLEAVPAAIELARRTVRVIRQNLAWAFAYNLLALPLAAGLLFPWTGWLVPAHWAGLAMAGSSILVVGNSLRLLVGESPR